MGGTECIYRRVELDLGLIVRESMRTRCSGAHLRNESRKLSATSGSSVSVNMCKRLQAEANVSPISIANTQRGSAW